jgi:hypothetical protein
MRPLVEQPVSRPDPLVEVGGPSGPTLETKAPRGLRCGHPLPLVEVGGPSGPTLETEPPRGPALLDPSQCAIGFSDPAPVSDLTSISANLASTTGCRPPT